MGPTASGKTDLAIELAEHHPFEIVSVDSAMVYRGLDIGTAKPDAATLARAPHRLIDICEPEDAYSAGQFVRDAIREIEAIRSNGRIPLLVGGTMLYFRALTEGLADLPRGDAQVREEIDRRAEAAGWPALHAELAGVDPVVAARVSPNDRQRIQRALEVYQVSGRPMSDWQADSAEHRPAADYLRFALVDVDRARLHDRINRRFIDMLDAGFIAEVEALRKRPGLSGDSSSMRAVGYRQIWAHLDGAYDLPDATRRAQAATRQLAKRQLTWLRSSAGIEVFDPLGTDTRPTISSRLKRIWEE